MATVTIGRSYFEALMRRAEFHTSTQKFSTGPDLSLYVTIPKAEHECNLQQVREYNLLKNALFRGGLTQDTFETLLSGESSIHEEPIVYPSEPNTWDETFTHPDAVPVALRRPLPTNSGVASNSSAVGCFLQPRHHSQLPSGGYSHGKSDSIDSSDKDEDTSVPVQHVPVQDQRTVLITNLSDRTTHKDLVSILRGGRLLDIFLRNDRTATVSFVEGAAEYLAYAKRNDIYFHTKRLEFRWNDRQFHVPPHVSNKIANGASRNLIVRGAAGKLTADQIREHLDHIHNLVIIDIYFRDGDAYISTNSIHNALFARTCMMSRTAYKGLRIDWYRDECAAPLPRPIVKAQPPSEVIPMGPVPITNPYTLLDTGSDLESESEASSYLTNGIEIRAQWADAAAA